MSHATRFLVLFSVALLVACCRAPEPKVDLQAEENKAIVREFFAAIDEGNLDRVKELVADDFALNAPGLPEPWGADMLFQAIKTHYASFPDWRHVIEDIIAEGDKVAVKLTQYGTHKAEYDGILATGNKVIMPAMHLIRIVDGKIKEWWAIEDNLGLMQQLGMELKPKEAK